MAQQLHNLKVVRVDDMAKTYIVEYETKLYRVHMVPEQVEKPRAFDPRGRVALTPAGEIAFTLYAEIKMTPEKQMFFRGFL